jgi:hypothetical protein
MQRTVYVRQLNNILQNVWRVTSNDRASWCYPRPQTADSSDPQTALVPQIRDLDEKTVLPSELNSESLKSTN